MDAQDARQLSEENAHRIAEREALRRAEAEAAKAKRECSIAFHLDRYRTGVEDSVRKAAKNGETSAYYSFGLLGYDPDWGQPDNSDQEEAIRRLRPELIAKGFYIVSNRDGGAWTLTW